MSDRYANVNNVIGAQRLATKAGKKWGDLSSQQRRHFVDRAIVEYGVDHSLKNQAEKVALKAKQTAKNTVKEAQRLSVKAKYKNVNNVIRAKRFAFDDGKDWRKISPGQRRAYIDRAIAKYGDFSVPQQKEILEKTKKAVSDVADKADSIVRDTMKRADPIYDAVITQDDLAPTPIPEAVKVQLRQQIQSHRASTRDAISEGAKEGAREAEKESDGQGNLLLPVAILAAIVLGV